MGRAECGRDLPDNASPAERKAHYNIVESIASAALSNDYQRNAEALRGIMAGATYQQATEEKQRKRNSAKTVGNAVEVEFGGAP